MTRSCKKTHKRVSGVCVPNNVVNKSLYARIKKKIRSLCGYNLLGKKAIIDPGADLLLMNRFLTWGWATWKDRWKEYEPSLKKIVNEKLS